MSEVILFNHIPKTAGSTLKHVLWRVYGGSSVAFAMGFHQERLRELRSTLTPKNPEVAVIVAHTGFGLHGRLPAHHQYQLVTFLRDPIERTISSYFFHRQVGDLDQGTSLLAFLERDVTLSYNAQTAFLGGLRVRQHLDGLELTRDHFDAELLAQAKQNLCGHTTVGLTEHFDKSLVLLQASFDWPRLSLLHRNANVGRLRPFRDQLTHAELRAVHASNELDIELYESAVTLFERQLEDRVPDVERRVAAFRRVNAAYGLCYPALYPPARSLVRLGRRLGRVTHARDSGSTLAGTRP